MDKQEKIIDGDFLRKKLTEDIPWVTILEGIVERLNRRSYMIEIKHGHINDINHDCAKYLCDYYPGIDPNAAKIAGAICHFASLSLPLRVSMVPNKYNNRDNHYSYIETNCKSAIWLAQLICRREKKDFKLSDSDYKDLLARLIHKKSECQGVINMLAGYLNH